MRVLYWAAALLSIVLAVVIYLSMREGEDVTSRRHPPTPTFVLLPSPTIRVIPTAVLPSAIPAVSTPTPTPMHVATPTPTSPPAPSEDQAEEVVHAYFEAIDSEDYEGALARTHGRAREQTSQIVDEIRSQEQESGQQADIRVTQLQLRSQPAHGSVRPVDVVATVGAYADLGIAEVEVQELHTEAVFDVALVEGEPKIVDIRQRS